MTTPADGRKRPPRYTDQPMEGSSQHDQRRHRRQGRPTEQEQPDHSRYQDQPKARLWKSRREIPDPQVRDAADQYEAARKLLSAKPPGSGVLLPLMNTAAVAIELYLKCLSAEKLHLRTGDASGCVTVHAAPVLAGRKGHELTSLIDAIPDEVRSKLEQAFGKFGNGDGCRDLLARCEGALTVSRYPFEAGSDLSSFDLPVLMRFSEFLCRFVEGLEPRERIQWK